MSLQGKTVIITGASSGIGKACAKEFARQGANLVLGARSYVALCEFSQELEKQYGIRSVAVGVDVSREEDCKHLIGQAQLTFGKIDVLVNNAGISMRALFKDLDLNVLRQVMDINFWGTVYCTKYALPAIIKSQGSIVGVSSIAGYKGLPGRTGYSASKFAMQGFLESVRIENLKNNVHVLLACPGFTASNIRNSALNKNNEQQGESSMDEGKMMTSEEVARIIVTGVKKRKRDLIITGQGKLTVFLSRWFPALTDKLVYNHFTKEKDPLLK
ncbi:SDR family oxidoreductase [Solitalea koreensis]|uniref:Short-chain dehydrogenase n=1 Tax=Solitalea koreensis TaxID=543615 RepID=A0A521BRP6_9SPHI|nr:SDR family oxidoreductase [Solitalea koreensis]SMO49401.1 Short-chain dehydrogenase [Solitalea koreensis]